MATARKPATVDPLLEELPPVPAEPMPESAADVKFKVRISTYVQNGALHYRWTIEDHTAKTHIDSYVGQGGTGFPYDWEAVKAAEQWIERCRVAIDLKLSQPDDYFVEL
jgi:hypothetical protein